MFTIKSVSGVRVCAFWPILTLLDPLKLHFEWKNIWFWGNLGSKREKKVARNGILSGKTYGFWRIWSRKVIKNDSKWHFEWKKYVVLMNLGALKCYYTKSKWPSGGVWINFDEFEGSQMLLYKVQMAVGRSLDQF